MARRRKGQDGIPSVKQGARNNGNGANLGFEAQLFLAAEKLRKNLEPSDHKHVALGLIFLRYISDAFEIKHAALLAEDPKAAEDPDEYLAENVFWVPKKARWPHLRANAKQPTIGKLIDEAMQAIEAPNSSLKGVLPKDYNRPALEAGEGNTAYLSRTTVRQLKLRLEATGIRAGAVFCRVIGRGAVTTDPHGRGRIGGRLSVDAVAQAFKRVAAWVKMPPEDVARVSGHSVRVGATQDLLALNIDLASVMQAGRWKTNRMPMRYGEHVLAARGGMARAAPLQGRDQDVETLTLA